MRNHRKVKAIRNKYGVVGYAIWNMLLEYLTGIDGNEIEFSDMEMDLMSGDFGVSVTEISDVVNYCIRLELLFLKNGFIHSETLDENLLPVYQKRSVAKSLSKQQLRNNGKYCNNNAAATGVSVTEMPQSRLDNINNPYISPVAQGRQIDVSWKKEKTAKVLKEKEDSFLGFFNEITDRSFKTLDKKAKRQFEYLIGKGYNSDHFKKAISNALFEMRLRGKQNYLTPEFITRETEFYKYESMPEMKINSMASFIPGN
jgi:hypothetical protein